MDKFIRLISVWSKVSLYGILGILAVIVVFMLSDVLFGVEFGYEPSDLLIAGGIAIITLALFAAIRGIVLFVKRH
jgi:hypothetical protein